MNAEALLAHSDFVRGLAGSLVLSMEDPEDVVQETWLAALSHPPRPGPGLKSWFAVVTRNALRQSRRGRLRRNAREMAAARREAVPSSEEIRSREAVRSEVVEAVLALPETYRSVVVLRYYEDLPPRKIAEKLELPVETVKTRLKRAHRKLRKGLDDSHGGDGRAWAIALLPIAGLGAGGPIAAVVGVSAAAVVLLALGAALLNSGKSERPAVAPDPSGEPPLVANAGGEADGPRAGGEVAGGADPASAEAETEIDGILVLGRDGKPTKAAVRTTPERGADLNRAIRMGETGSDGILRREDFERAPRGFVWASGPRDRPGVAGPVRLGETGGAVLRLGEGCVLTGTVRDEAGKPLSGVLVKLRDEVFTDAEGRFRYSCLFPETPYEVLAAVMGFHRKRDAARARVRFDAPDSTKDVALVLSRPPGGSLLLRIPQVPTDRMEKLVLVLEVGGSSNDMRFTAGPLMRLHLPMPPGTEGKITASLPGFAPGSAPFRTPTGAEDEEVRIDLGASPMPRTGRVVNADGEPVAGATVLACPEAGAIDERNHERDTDGDGVFDLDPRMTGKHLVALVKGVSASPWLHLTEDATEVVLRLGPGGAVLGRVLDETTGEPVAGAGVELGLGARDFSPIEFWTRTDEAGRYRFDGVPAGVLAVPTVMSSLRVTSLYDRGDLLGGREEMTPKEVVDRGFGAVLEGPGTTFTRDLEARARKGRECVVDLTFPAGVAPPARVLTHQESRTPTSRRSVSRWTDLDPGAPRFTGFFPVGENRVHVTVGRLWSQAFEYEVVDEGAPLRAALVLNRSPRFLLRLVDETGEPIRLRDVAVEVWDWQGGGGSGGGKSVTDSEGMADVTELLPSPTRIEGKGREIRFVVEADGFLAGGPREPNAVLPIDEYLRILSAGDGAEVVHDVVLRGARRVEVRVTDESGSPLEGVTVRGSEDLFVDPEVVSDGDGWVRLRMMSVESFGEPVLSAAPPWDGTLELGKLLGEGSGAVRGTLVVEPARETRLRFVDGEGRPLARTGIRCVYDRTWLDRGGYERLELMTDADGRVTIHLPRKLDWLRVDTRGFLGRQVTLDLSGRETVIRLERTVAVEVRIVPKGEFPGGRIRVEALADGEEDPVEVETFEPGFGERVTTLALPARPLDIVVGTADGLWTGRAAWPGRGGRIDVPIEAVPLYPVVLRVVDLEGNALAGVTAEIRRNWRERRYVTDPNGEFRIELPEGRYEDIDVRLAGLRVKSGPGRIEVPSKEPAVVVASPRAHAQAFFLDFRKSAKEADLTLVEVRFRDGAGPRPGHGGSTRTSLEGMLILRVEVPFERCTIEVEYDGQVFTHAYEGSEVKPPVFSVR